MKNKIKKMQFKEDGFTLVELLAVIVILGIVVAIAIPAVGSVIDRAEVDAEESEMELVEDAARLYVTTGAETLEWSRIAGKATATINVKSDLIDGGYLEERSQDGAKFTDSDTVIVERNPIGAATDEKGYTYKFEYKPGN